MWDFSSQTKRDIVIKDLCKLRPELSPELKLEVDTLITIIKNGSEADMRLAITRFAFGTDNPVSVN